MAKKRAPKAVRSVRLASGRWVTVGDSLRFDEAADLLITQGGDSPLQPVATLPESSWHIGFPCFNVALSGARTAKSVLMELLSGNPALILDEAAAEAAHDLYAETLNTPVPVPIGGGRFVLQHFEHLTGDPLGAFLDWQSARFDRQLLIGDMEIEASSIRPAQA